MASNRTNTAYSALTNWESKKPGAYQSKYTDQISDATGKLQNLKFDYNNFNTEYNPTENAEYKAAKNNYTRQAELANLNAQANAAALTGGYGSSYATQLGQSAYANAMSNLDGLADDLYDEAYSRWQTGYNTAYNDYTNQRDQLQSLISAYQQADANDLNAYNTALQEWQNQRDYYQSEYNNAVSADQSKRANTTNWITTGLSVAASILPYVIAAFL